ncbi:unnamed protein product [Ostreobium quekettii]|uniref:Uncharacterized protein n=1 Tax=Ostreobium quekettii TaxID=121088 RepID=A0A8S1IVQ2_9CHLO|nr:unnamed protein product [Ostreobium quekettii]
MKVPGRLQIRNRPQQLQPNGVVRSRRPRFTQPLRGQNGGTSIAQPPATRLKPWIRSQVSIRGAIERQPRQHGPSQQRPQHYNSKRLSPAAGVGSIRPRGWVQPAVRTQSKGRQLLRVRASRQSLSNGRLVQGQAMQPSHYCDLLEHAPGGIRKPVRPAGRTIGRAASAPIQQARRVSTTDLCAKNKQCGSYARNARRGGSRGFRMGGFKMTTLRR